MPSLIYKNLLFYRFIMNLLYAGSYRSRFKPVLSLIDGKTLLELCFGDTIIAQWCRRHHVQWTGYDINEKFVHCAKKKGFDARQADLKQYPELPFADVCVMTGSLYHFWGKEEQILRMILKASPKAIISEPVRNISSVQGFIGRMARRSAAENDNSAFRYDRKSFIALMENLSHQIGFKYKIAGSFKKDLIVLITK
jgi:hypothetical protein